MRTKELILLIISCFFLLSCNYEIESNDAYSSPEITATSPTIWQEQLEYAKNNHIVNTKSETDKVYLIDYKYKGVISSENEITSIIEQLFSKDTYIVQYLDNKTFEITTLNSAIQKKGTSDCEKRFADLKHQLEVTIGIGMELIEAKWYYKGNTYSSLVIASNDHGGVIYDHIGFMILDSTNITEIEKPQIDIPITKTVSETGKPTKKVFSRSYSGQNLMGVKVWEYSLYCCSEFANNKLKDRTLNSYRWSAFGWTCQAEITTINGEIDSSSFHEFAWGYVYGAAYSVSLKWNGLGFTISGSGTGQTGTEVHRP